MYQKPLKIKSLLMLKLAIWENTFKTEKCPVQQIIWRTRLNSISDGFKIRNIWPLLLFYIPEYARNLVTLQNLQIILFAVRYFNRSTIFNRTN